VRIIRGKFKTRRYPVPKGFPSRPTTDFAKEGLFNLIENRIDLFDLKILDLCAGTGNISFEFLSREAGHVTAIDSNFNCVRHMKSMARKFECEGEINILKSDILKFLKSAKGPYDLIFADPPYAYDQHEEIHQLIFENGLLTEGGWLIMEHSKETNLENRTHFDFSRKYGGVTFSFFQNIES